MSSSFRPTVGQKCKKNLIILGFSLHFCNREQASSCAMKPVHDWWADINYKYRFRIVPGRRLGAVRNSFCWTLRTACMKRFSVLSFCDLLVNGTAFAVSFSKFFIFLKIMKICVDFYYIKWYNIKRYAEVIRLFLKIYCHIRNFSV